MTACSPEALKHASGAAAPQRHDPALRPLYLTTAVAAAAAGTGRGGPACVCRHRCQGAEQRLPEREHTGHGRRGADSVRVKTAFDIQATELRRVGVLSHRFIISD